MRALLILLFTLSTIAVAEADGPPDLPLTGLMTLTDTTTHRISSYNRTGGNTDFVGIAPGQTIELADIEGTGIIRHLYFSIWGGEHYLRDMVIRAYWDGSETPCVEVPFGDFFGLGHERPRFYTSLMVTLNPGDLGVFGTFGFNHYFPMPFEDGARLTLTNDGTDPVIAVWYHVEFEKMAELPPDSGRFHATWNRENPTEAVGDVINTTLHDGINTTGDENYVLLDAEGHGSLVGIFLNIDNTMGNWYGEGDDMIFIDGEAWPPSYHGTGSEEIFGGGAVPTDEYAGPYTGFHLISNLDFSGKVSMYRFYVNDPVRFRKSIRMTLEHGHANNISNDYSSTALWYQTEPHKPFNPLPPAAERRPNVGDDPADQAYLKLFSLRTRIFGLLILSIRDNVALPEDLAYDLKWGISQTYFQRNYAQLVEEAAALEARIDAYMAGLAADQAEASEATPEGG
jgi:hypothetical protein